jgi:hypothetical protein
MPDRLRPDLDGLRLTIVLPEDRTCLPVSPRQRG